MREAEKSITGEVLKSLIPYSNQNLKLAFKPNRFFSELERSTSANRNTLAATMSRAKRKGWVSESSGVPVLTKAGLARIRQTRQAEELVDGWLLVVFDIPETQRKNRDQLRIFLKTSGFRQLQKSTWYSQEDRVDELKETIGELKIGKYVRVFIATHVFSSEIY